MPLRLISKDETQDVTVEGTTFKVRVRPGTWFDDRHAKYAAGGEFDAEKFRDEFYAENLVGWDELIGLDGKPMEYSRENAVLAGRWLPESAQNAINAAVRARARKADAALGN